MSFHDELKNAAINQFRHEVDSRTADELEVYITATFGLVAYCELAKVALEAHIASRTTEKASEAVKAPDAPKKMHGREATLDRPVQFDGMPDTDYASWTGPTDPVVIEGIPVGTIEVRKGIPGCVGCALFRKKRGCIMCLSRRGRLSCGKGADIIYKVVRCSNGLPMRGFRQIAGKSEWCAECCFKVGDHCLKPLGVNCVGLGGRIFSLGVLKTVG